MRLLIKGLIVAVALLAVVVVGGVAGLLIFGTTKAPEPLGSVTKPFATMDYGCNLKYSSPISVQAGGV